VPEYAAVRPANPLFGHSDLIICARRPSSDSRPLGRHRIEQIPIPKPLWVGFSICDQRQNLSLITASELRVHMVADRISSVFGFCPLFLRSAAKIFDTLLLGHGALQGLRAIRGWHLNTLCLVTYVGARIDRSIQAALRFTGP